MKIYKCVPELNRECSKENCFINGGPCYSTFDIEKSTINITKELKKILYDDEYTHIEKLQQIEEIIRSEDNEKIKCEKPIEIAPFKVDTSINVGETTYVGIGSDKGGI